MKTADYTIELHNRGGCYKTVPFTGTRRQAREHARKITPQRDGHHINFLRYTGAEHHELKAESIEAGVSTK